MCYSLGTFKWPDKRLKEPGRFTGAAQTSNFGPSAQPTASQHAPPSPQLTLRTDRHARNSLPTAAIQSAASHCSPPMGAPSSSPHRHLRGTRTGVHAACGSPRRRRFAQEREARCTRLLFVDPQIPCLVHPVVSGLAAPRTHPLQSSPLGLYDVHLILLLLL
jgi:hypothetical protein